MFDACRVDHVVFEWGGARVRMRQVDLKEFAVFVLMGIILLWSLRNLFQRVLGCLSRGGWQRWVISVVCLGGLSVGSIFVAGCSL
jgi:hypothetical protein